MGKAKKSEASVEDQESKITATMMAVNPGIASAWVGVFAEGTRFLAHRLRQDLATQKAILDCNNATELLAVQAEFFETAIEDYSKEVMRLSNMVLRATEEAVEDAVSSHSVNNDDLPI